MELKVLYFYCPEPSSKLSALKSKWYCVTSFDFLLKYDVLMISIQCQVTVRFLLRVLFDVLRHCSWNISEQYWHFKKSRT
jgi:hypothetical protein